MTEWDTEVLSSGAARQLGRLKEILETSVPVDKTQLRALVATDFSCGMLRPSHLTDVFRDEVIQVRRPQAGSKSDEAQTALGFGQACENWLEGLVGTAGSLRVDFKIVGIQRASNTFTTRILVELAAPITKGVSQRNSVWICRWLTTSKDENFIPLVQSIRLEDYEEVNVPSAEGTLFVDCTRSALRNLDSHRQQILRGIEFWSTRLTRIDDMHIHGHHGMAVGDANGDGLEDIYVCDAGGLPNRLYIQNDDGTLTDRTSDSGTDWLEASSSALFLDLDNDGDQDLVVGTVALILFAENDGTGRFQLRGGHRGVNEVHSMCSADFDNDGRLDIYCCNYGGGTRGGDPRGFEATLPVPYNDANNGGSNALLRNLGDFDFLDVTDAVGLNDNNSRFSFAAAWEDYDNDGDADLYVANDFGRNNLYRNQDGKFSDVAAHAGAEDMAAGMSVSWADYNRDGLADLYVGNMFSAAGNRVVFQRRFQDAGSVNRNQGMQRMTRGNTLFSASIDGSFRDVSRESNVTMGRWAWSSKFADLNNDGWMDVVVANGYLTHQRTDDL